MTENPNNVYEGEKHLENSEVHMQTVLHISRNNTPGTLVNKSTNNICILHSFYNFHSKLLHSIDIK